MKEQISHLLEVSEVLGSGKRTVLLFMLNEKPMSYTDMTKRFARLETRIGSSEIYKHLEVLLRTKYIVKKGKTYMVTLKGKTLIDAIGELVDTPPTIPRIKIVF